MFSTHCILTEVTTCIEGSLGYRISAPVFQCILGFSEFLHPFLLCLRIRSLLSVLSNYQNFRRQAIRPGPFAGSSPWWSTQEYPPRRSATVLHLTLLLTTCFTYWVTWSIQDTLATLILVIILYIPHEGMAQMCRFLGHWCCKKCTGDTTNAAHSRNKIFADHTTRPYVLPFMWWNRDKFWLKSFAERDDKANWRRYNAPFYEPITSMCKYPPTAVAFIPPQIFSFVSTRSFFLVSCERASRYSMLALMYSVGFLR